MSSSRNLLLRSADSEETVSNASNNLLSGSPSLSSLNRLRDTFRRSESISSQISALVSNAAGVVTGSNNAQTGIPSEVSSASSQTCTPKKRKPGKFALYLF